MKRENATTEAKTKMKILQFLFENLCGAQYDVWKIAQIPAANEQK